MLLLVILPTQMTIQKLQPQWFQMTIIPHQLTLIPIKTLLLSIWKTLMSLERKKLDIAILLVIMHTLSPWLFHTWIHTEQMSSSDILLVIIIQDYLRFQVAPRRNINSCWIILSSESLKDTQRTLLQIKISKTQLMSKLKSTTWKESKSNLWLSQLTLYHGMRDLFMILSLWHRDTLTTMNVCLILSMK